MAPTEGLRPSDTDHASPIQVLFAHDQALLREGVRALLSFYDDVQIVALAASAEEALARSRATEPDVALVGVSLPDRSGVLACRDILTQCPGTAVIMLNSVADDEWVFASIAAGAAGCLLEHVDGAGLVEAVRRVAAGQSLLDPAVASRVFARLRTAASAIEPIDERLARLTPVERRVLALVADGLANRGIATELGYAVPTVKKYVSSILSKLEVSRRTQAAAYLTHHAPRHVDL